MITLHKERTFRQTPGVHFADIGVPGSNGIDLVEHAGRSVSPPNKFGCKQWYVHRYQTDNNRVIKGYRLFELFNPAWEDPHWLVMLDENSGALEIPVGCYHRSYSCHGGSLLINHAIREHGYDERYEFNPALIYGHLIYQPKYHGCTPHQAKKFIEFGTPPA